MATVSYIDHTADIGVKISAATPEEAFIAVAEAMFDIMVPERQVEQRQTWEIEISAADWEGLLVAWLEELLYRFEMEGLLPARIELSGSTAERLSARIRGDTLDPAVHERGVGIKAVTWHQLQARPREAGFEIQVIFDI